MSKYNKCEGCELWNGHHCTGARSYEPNADKHRIICNEHIAKQFWVVYQQLHRSEARVKELKEQLKAKEQENERSLKRISDLEARIINHSNEVEEYCNRLADKSKECEKYEQALTEIKEIAEENIRIADLEGLNGVYRRGLAKQILQKISEVKND